MELLEDREPVQVFNAACKEALKKKRNTPILAPREMACTMPTPEAL